MSVTEHLHGLEPHAHGHAGKGAGLFSKRIGPLSAGAWLGVIVGGIALGMYAKNHGPLSSASSDSSAADVAPEGDPGGLSSTGAAPEGSSSGTIAGSASGSGITDNASWEAAAIKQLITNGIRPGIAQPAIVNFLSGNLLPAEQGAAVELAIRLIGSPPDGAPALMVAPGSAAPTPSPTATTVPTTTTAPTTTRPTANGRPTASPLTPTHAAVSAHTYNVVSGDTLSGIAARKHLSSWTALYELNAATIESAARAHGRTSSDHGHWIYPGTVLRLP